MAVRRTSRVAVLLQQLSESTQRRRAAERAEVEAQASTDIDQDGVPDATEAFLGTSLLTDETFAGRYDDGFCRAPDAALTPRRPVTPAPAGGHSPFSVQLGQVSGF